MNNQSAKQIATEFLKKVETCKLVGYLDLAGVPTDGYGNTVGVVVGKEISQIKADQDLQVNINKAYNLLEPKLKNACLLQHEIAALISFVFNCGCGNWNIWKLLDQNKLYEIPNELMRFDHARVNGKLVEVQGLKNRRLAEVQLWQTADTDLAITDTVINVSDGTYSDRDIAPNTLQVEPKPNFNKNSGVQLVAGASVVSAVAVAGHNSQLNPTFIAGIVGFIIGCAFVLLFAIGLYFWNKHKEPEKMPVSDAFNTAVSNFVAAAKAAQVQAVADAVANAETTADADATAAIVAAQQANFPAAPVADQTTV